MTDDSSLVLAVYNAHDASSGPPPDIVAAYDCNENYISYFQSSDSAQWVLEVDQETKQGVLRGGDIRWTSKVEIIEGEIFGELILGPAEIFWLVGAWLAATGCILQIPDPWRTLSKAFAVLGESQDSFEGVKASDIVE